MIKLYLSFVITVIWSILTLAMAYVVRQNVPTANLLLIGALIFTLGLVFNYYAFKRYDQLNSSTRRQHRLQRMVKQLDPEDREILFQHLTTDSIFDPLEEPMPLEKRKNQA